MFKLKLRIIYPSSLYKLIIVLSIFNMKINQIISKFQLQETLCRFEWV